MSYIRILLTIICFITTASCSSKIGYLSILGEEAHKSVQLFYAHKTAGQKRQTAHLESITHSRKHPLELPSGQYLLVADCSHRWIILRPREHQQISLTKVSFAKPLHGNDDHKKEHSATLPASPFSIQCESYKDGSFPQVRTNTFDLHMLPGHHKLSINHMPLEISIPEEGTSAITFPLGALMVALEPHKHNSEHSYFLETQDHYLEVTQAYKLNKWSYLIPGKYGITINGSHKKVLIEAGKAQKIPTALLRFEASQISDTNILEKTSHALVTRAPYMVDFLSARNTKHPLEIGVTYPFLVLPNQAFQISFSNKTRPLTLKETELTRIPLKTLMVESYCHRDTTSQLQCLKSMDITLFENIHSPLIKATSDIPIPYLNSPIWVELSTSYGLKRKISNARHSQIKVGSVTFTPKIQNHNSSSTDLIRIETTKDTPTTYSLDLSSKQTTTLQLMEGTYALVSYDSQRDSGSEYRTKLKRKRLFRVKAGHNLPLEGVFYR